MHFIWIRFFIHKERVVRRLIMVAGKVLKAAFGCRSFQVLNNVLPHCVEQKNSVSTEKVTQISKFESGNTRVRTTRQKQQRIQAC